MSNINMRETGPQFIFIEESWITGDTCVFAITNPIDRAKAKAGLLKMRKNFIARLLEDGFLITTDKANLSDGTICLIMNDLAISKENVPINVYKKKFDQRIFEAGGKKLNYPRSLAIEDFFNEPFFPAVFKNESTNGGQDKFLIETPEQLAVIKRFYLKYSSRSPYKEAFGCSVFQQFIETPTSYKTYMRVLMSASGEVMGASLKYSIENSVNRKTQGIFEKHFCDSKSEYFLDCQGMFGYYSGGGNISFCQSRYSTEKQLILQAHGINPQQPQVPMEVVEVASAIAQKCNRELGIISGIDFIQNVHDGKWYYLEIQAFPAIDEWAIPNGIKLPQKGSIENYLKYCEVDLEARYAALMMCMEQKERDKQIIKTK